MGTCREYITAYIFHFTVVIDLNTKANKIYICFTKSSEVNYKKVKGSLMPDFHT